MPIYCDVCGTRKVPAEENAWICPTCERDPSEEPRICDYCHEHVASVPSGDGTWTCDYCIMAALVGPAAYAEILETQARLTRASGHPVSLGEALSAWRELAETAKASITSPAKEVNAHAS